MAGPLTRYYVEQVAVSRTRAVMAFAKLSTALDPNTPNPDLSDPIATALEELGYPPQDRSNVTDLDLLPVGPAWQARFLDLVELRVLDSCAQQALVQPESVQWEDFKKTQGMSAKGLQDYIEARWKRYQARWAQSGTVASCVMAPANRHPLRTAGYYPPYEDYPPLGRP